MNLPHFDFHNPASLDECASLLKCFGKEAEIVAGGTDLFVRMKHRLKRPSHLVSLSKIDGLDSISLDSSSGMILGVRVKLAELARSPMVREKYTALSEAASLVATRQIRNMATLGGNILQDSRCLYYNRSMTWGKAVPPCMKRDGSACHAVAGSQRCFAVYQGDIAPVLIALGARANLFPPGKTGEIALEDLFTGDGKVPCRGLGGKVLTSVTLPVSLNPIFTAYRKYRLRDGMDFPLAGVAVVVRLDQGTIADIRICLTGVWSSPVLVKEAVDIARGKTLTAVLAKGLADAAYRAAHPVANLEGNPESRRSMIWRMVEEILSVPP